MRLSGMRMDHASYESRIDVSELPEKLEQQDLENTLKGVRAGDNDSKIKMIRGHMRLTFSIISRYVPQAPWKIDDLIGQGLFGLTQAVNWVSEGRMAEHDNITGYIVQTVHRFISEFLEMDHTVRIPRRSIPTLGVSDLDEVKPVYDPNIERVGFTEDRQVAYINEILDMIIESPTEKVIILMRSQSYTDEEIATALGYRSKATICMIRETLYQKFLKLYKKI